MVNAFCETVVTDSKGDADTSGQSPSPGRAIPTRWLGGLGTDYVTRPRQPEGR